MLEPLYLISQVVAAIAVVASLLFVGMQLKANSVAQRVTNLQDHTAQLNAWSRLIAEQPQNAELWINGLNNFETLSDSERVRFSQLVHALTRTMQLFFAQRQIGALEEEMWSNNEHMFDELMHTPGFRTWWSARGHWYTDRFQSYVNSRIGDAPESWLLKEGAFDPASNSTPEATAP